VVSSARRPHLIRFPKAGRPTPSPYAKRLSSYRGRDTHYCVPPRTDPGGRDSRTGLPPWVFDGEAFARPGMKDTG
jgi:hypothetical protein